MPKTLIIESDRAYELAHARARAEGKSVAAVVEEALEPVAAATAEPTLSAADREARITRILDRARALRATLPAGVTSDHAFLYDESGLPL